MSINSILTNPKILDEIIAEVDSRISNVTIKTLENNDGNVDVSVLDFVGTVNLKPNISVNKITCLTSIQTPEITTTNPILSIEANNNKISLSQDNITLQINNDNYIELLNTNICNLVNTNLKLNNMISPYSTDGTAGQVLATDGNNNAVWANLGEPSGLLKQIYQLNKQMVTQVGAIITLFFGVIEGFTVGKTSIYDISFTSFQNDPASNYSIIASFGDSVSQTITSNDVPIDIHSPRKVVLQQINASVDIPFGVYLQSTSGIINTDPNDYFSLNISEY